jgi:hypothetical protein
MSEPVSVFELEGVSMLGHPPAGSRRCSTCSAASMPDQRDGARRLYLPQPIDGPPVRILVQAPSIGSPGRRASLTLA